ncbi:MAG: 6-phosphofructokinase [Deltaproteobacteria bacterium]|nr:MAG: 6-phosphofructokinase [Deltaproteobacteria bacterium]
MKNIAVLTSGGDAPGMNAAIRAVVRTGIHQGFNVIGIQNGYSGLFQERFITLKARDVGGILHQGGTFLGTSRCPTFKTKTGQKKAIQLLKQQKIDGLIVIGGSGSQSGAYALSQLGFPVVGIASTIDNDLSGIDITIGVDTALNIALEAIDRLRVTASSHQRAFLVEMMGRNSGYLALMAGLAGGAEAILIPEVKIDPLAIAKKLRAAYTRGKTHALAVVAEGAKWNAQALARYFKKNRKLGFDLRVTTLGHVQRGGIPTVFDRLLATQLGAAAIQSLAQGKSGILWGWKNGAIASFPLSQIILKKKSLDLTLLTLADILAK